VDFHAKRKAFYVIGEKMKTNDTYQTFKAKKSESNGRWSSTCSLEKIEGETDNVNGQNGESGKTNDETKAETTSNQNTAATNPSNQDTTTTNQSNQNTATRNRSNSNQKEMSISMPLLLCILVAIVACLVALLVNPEAQLTVRTYIQGLTSYQNGKVPT
jgi:cobalamin biosynthesis Mg chelatase CobN